MRRERSGPRSPGQTQMHRGAQAEVRKHLKDTAQGWRSLHSGAPGGQEAKKGNNVKSSKPKQKKRKPTAGELSLPVLPTSPQAWPPDQDSPSPRLDRAHHTAQLKSF